VSAPSGDDEADDAQRRRLRDEVFGDVLPETTGDERSLGAGETDSGGNDEWLRSNVPPHHG
jgi:hypothetical protein